MAGEHISAADFSYLQVMKVTGIVARKTLSAGSKSERDGYCLITPDKEYIVQEIGANPFTSNNLQLLVGKEVELEGTIDGNRFLIKRNFLKAGTAEKKKGKS